MCAQYISIEGFGGTAFCIVIRCIQSVDIDLVLVEVRGWFWCDFGLACKISSGLVQEVG